MLNKAHARLFKVEGRKNKGRILGTYEDFVIFKHDLPSDALIDIYRAISTYQVSHGNNEYRLFGVIMLSPSTPSSLLELHNFLYDIHLSAYTDEERSNKNR